MSPISIESIFLLFSQVVLHQDVHQRDGCIFHAVHEVIDCRHEVVVKNLQHHTHNKTTDRCDKGHFHTTGNNLRRDVTSSFDSVEREHHPHNRSKESKHRSE